MRLQYSNALNSQVKRIERAAELPGPRSGGHHGDPPRDPLECFKHATLGRLDREAEHIGIPRPQLACLKHSNPEFGDLEWEAIRIFAFRVPQFPHGFLDPDEQLRIARRQQRPELVQTLPGQRQRARSDAQFGRPSRKSSGNHAVLRQQIDDQAPPSNDRSPSAARSRDPVMRLMRHWREKGYDPYRWCLPRESRRRRMGRHPGTLRAKEGN